MAKTYGKIQHEQQLEQAAAARDISRTVIDYGVSQYQITKIIYLLSLELENRDMADGIFTAVEIALGNSDNDDNDNQKENKLIVR
ncbi:MAG: hypothetical protein H8E12_09200 [Rhodobacteraceae bacterium]|nr:hypothetical protein [Paracoccaceae bacterium]